VPARELFELRYGKALVQSARRPGCVPVYGTNGRCGTHDEGLFAGPGVIIGRKGQGPLGVEWCDQSYWVIDTAYSLTPLRPDTDLKFFYYLIKYIGLNHLKDGTSNPSLSRETFGAQALPLPPLEEQRRIADIISSLDNKIELNRRMNRTLESIARAIFKSWFIDFDPASARTAGAMEISRALCDEFPNSMASSSIGTIPKGWRVATIGDVAVELEAGSRPAGGVGDIADGVPSIGAESIVGIGRFDYTKTKHVTRDFWSGMRRGHVKDFDVLVYKDGGRPGMFEPHATLVGDAFPFAECCINEHVYRLRVSDELSQAYVYFWLTSELAIGEMRERGTGVAIPSLNSTAFRAVPILVPNAAVVDSFSKVVEPLVSAILANAKQSRTLLMTRDALLPALLRGELQSRESQRDASGAQQVVA
jgi:type I restriction enzyme S subunit